MAVGKSIEDDIKQYLDSLTKALPVGRRAVDREAVRALRDRLKQATDPIVRLELAKELRAASEPKQVEPAEHPKLKGFLADGKAWAAEHGYTAGDLQRYAKVPVDVLRAAGFVVPSGADRRGGRRRAPRIDIADVLVLAKKLKSPWKLADLAAQVERDAATTRNYVNKLVADGLVKVVGEDASGTGRPAKLYELIK